MATETITLRLVAQDLASGNISKAISGIDKMAQRGGIMGSVFQGVGLSMGMMLNPLNLMMRGFDTATDIFGDSVAAARDQEEALNRVVVVLGDASSEVEAFAKTTADGFGISEEAALSAAGWFANLFTEVGLTKERAAEFSIELTKLAADLGSFMNLDPSIALEKLQGGLVGQTRQLRELGIIFEDADVTRKMREMGLEATQQNKVLARYNLILDQSSNAHGDFARTSDRLANAQRRANAQLDDALSDLGAVLLPLATEFTAFMADAIPAVVEIVSQTQKLGDAIRGILSDIDAAATGEVRLSTTAQLVADEFGVEADALIAMTNQMRRNALVMDVIIARQQELERALPIDTIDLADLSTMDLAESTEAAAGATRELTQEEKELRAAAEALIQRNAELQEAEVNANRIRTVGVSVAKESVAVGEDWIDVIDTWVDHNRFYLGAMWANIKAAARSREESERLSAAIDIVADESFSDLRDAANEAGKAIRRALKRPDDKSLNQLLKERTQLERQYTRAVLEGDYEAQALITQRLETVDEEIGARRSLRRQIKAQQDDVAELADEYGVSQKKVARILARERGDIDKTREALEKLDDTDVTIDIDIPIGAALTAIGNVKSALRELVGGTWTPRLGPSDLGGRRGDTRAAGGPVAAGRTYLVGERGPELLTMGRSGFITPNSAIGGVTAVFNVGFVKDSRDFVETVGPDLTRWLRQQGVA